MRVLPVRIVKQIVFHIQGNGTHASRDIIFGNGPAGEEGYTAQEKCEE